MTRAAHQDCTTDAFLNGKVHVLQPRKGFRSGIDAVLLAAAVPAKSGESVLELGCGVGVAALCLHARVPGLALQGVELQGDYAALARRNVTANNAQMQIVSADLRALPTDLRQMQFDHVMMNPPYFARAKGSAADDLGRDVALAGETPLTDWLDVGLKRLAPKGTLTVIQHITRLPDVLGHLAAPLGSIVAQPIAGRSGTAPNLFILQGRHSGRAPFRLKQTLVLHEGAEHMGDRESYTPETRAVLRDGAALNIND